MDKLQKRQTGNSQTMDNALAFLVRCRNQCLWCGYRSALSQSFELRHLVISRVHNTNIFCAKSSSQSIASGNGQWFLFLQKQSGKLFLYLNLRHTDILTPRVKNLWDTRCVSFVEYTQRGTESTQATQTQWRFGTVAVNLVRARIR